jgi:hypothetical protein
MNIVNVCCAAILGVSMTIGTAAAADRPSSSLLAYLVKPQIPMVTLVTPAFYQCGKENGKELTCHFYEKCCFSGKDPICCDRGCAPTGGCM